MADLILPRGKVKVLKAEDKDYDRGLLVKLLDDGGYKMAYWYDKPNKPYPIEIIVDGKSITKDGKIVEMKFHPKDYYDKQEESKMGLKLEEVVGKKLTEEQFDEAAGKKDACYHKVKARYDVWPSAYASGALVKCRKVGAKNWGNKSKKKESVSEDRTASIIQNYEREIQAIRSKYPPGTHKSSMNYNDESKIGELENGIAYAKSKQEGYPGKSIKPLHDDEVNERTRMKPQVKKLLKQKGYGPIFGAIDNSKRQLKQMRYSRGEIQDTLISMFGDEDPKILQKIKESINEKKGDFLDSLFPKSKVAKAVKIAHDMGGNMTGAVKKIEKYFKGMTLHTKVQDALRQANEGFASDAQRKAAFASGYEEKGKKKKKESVEEAYDIWMEDGSWGYTMTGLLPEAEYQGRKVKLGKPMQGDVKKFKVYVKNPKGNVVKVNFGQGGDAKGGTMRIRKSNPNARKNFRARHNCDNPGPRHKARYWSCRKW